MARPAVHYRLDQLETIHLPLHRLVVHGVSRAACTATTSRSSRYRLYREEGLSIRSKTPKRKRAQRYRQDRPGVSDPNEVWAMDFMSDQLFDGRPFRMLTVVDRYARESLAIVPRVSFRD